MSKDVDLNLDYHLHFVGGMDSVKRYIMNLHKHLRKTDKNFFLKEQRVVCSTNHCSVFDQEEIEAFAALYNFRWIQAIGIVTLENIEFNVYNPDPVLDELINKFYQMRILRANAFMDYLEHLGLNIELLENVLLNLNETIESIELEALVEIINFNDHSIHSKVKKHIETELPEWRPSLEECRGYFETSNTYMVNPPIDNPTYNFIKKNNFIRGIVINLGETDVVEIWKDLLKDSVTRKSLLHGTGRTVVNERF